MSRKKTNLSRRTKESGKYAPFYYSCRGERKYRYWILSATIQDEILTKSSFFFDSTIRHGRSQQVVFFSYMFENIVDEWSIPETL